MPTLLSLISIINHVIFNLNTIRKIILPNLPSFIFTSDCEFVWVYLPLSWNQKHQGLWIFFLLRFDLNSIDLWLFFSHLSFTCWLLWLFVNWVERLCCLDLSVNCGNWYTMAGERDEIPREISLEQEQLNGFNDLMMRFRKKWWEFMIRLMHSCKWCKGTICNPNKGKPVGCNKMLL